MDAIIMIAAAIMIIENYDIDNNEEDDACYHLCPYKIGSLASWGHGGGYRTYVTTSRGGTDEKGKGGRKERKGRESWKCPFIVDGGGCTDWTPGG